MTAVFPRREGLALNPPSPACYNVLSAKACVLQSSFASDAESGTQKGE